MRIAITGANGQLGRALQQALGGAHELVPLTRADIDLAQPSTVERVAQTNADVVIHAAAYTNVDGCARDPLHAYRVNALGTQYVAQACQHLDARLVYVSTNEVFDGTADRAYYEYDHAAPINPYGWSKWAGEQTVRELLRTFYIVRVAWLFGGERNFVQTVLRLADERDELTIVADEIGSPTYAPDAAAAIARLIELPCYGTYHIVNDGACSRYELARAVLARADRRVRLLPLRLADYQRASRVPPYTPLRNIAAAALGITLRPWQAAVAECVAAR